MLEFWRALENISIPIPALKRPTLWDLRKQFPWIEKIEGDSSPTEAVTLRLGTVLRTDENRIGGEEYKRRLGLRSGTFHGYQQAVWLVEHQDEHPAFMALLGKVYIDFPGLVVVDGVGDRYCPCLFQDGSRWYPYWDWIGVDFGSGGRLASSCK
jgi:hypothetical protein